MLPHLSIMFNLHGFLVLILSCINNVYITDDPVFVMFICFDSNSSGIFIFLIFFFICVKMQSHL